MSEKKLGAIGRFFERVGKKNLVIVGAVLLIGVAVLVNWMIFKDEGGFTYDGGDGPVGVLDNTKDPTSDENESGGGTTDTATDSYFSSVQVSRQRARDEAIEVLLAVIENQNATEEVKAEAAAEMAQISLEMQQEANIESIIVSKGFERCIAVIGDGAASIVVKCSETLTPAQLAQINTVVYEQAGIEPINISIVSKA